MGAEAARKENVECEVINFPGVKLKKDGTPKGTKNNTKKNRDDIMPIKEEDIPKMVKWLRNYRNQSKNAEDYQIRFRNLTMFIMGINIALRVSDLVSLRWNDIYDDKWEFLDGKKITPKKTANKNKKVLLAYNNSFRRAVEDYRNYVKPEELDSYIFNSRENPDGHICPTTVESFLKKMVKELEIDYPVCTHSLRKTFARVRYDHSKDKTKTLVELMEMYRHTNTQTTLHYICIRQEEIKNVYYEVELGYDESEVE